MAPGRTRKKLAILLTEALQSVHPGIAVDPEQLWWERGIYSTARLDKSRWGATLCVSGRQAGILVYSWDTMNACLKHGFTVIVNPENSHDIEISARC
jgi:hypothetical protein